MNVANSSVAQRVRTYCKKDAMRPGALFAAWECEKATAEEENKQAMDYLPVSIGALFGAR